MNPTIQVAILTFCRKQELFYGTELIFKTLRTGFPNAQVSVFDNCSIPDARVEIERLAGETDCRFEPIEGGPMAHDRFIEERIRACADVPGHAGPLVFLDPDICLWESCEDFGFDGLMAGLRVRRFRDQFTDTVMMPRLHTSFLWIPDPRALWTAVLGIQTERFDFSPFRSFSVMVDGEWRRYDTGASLFAAMPERMSCFTRHHRERFDHIFSGSHLDWLLPSRDPEFGAMLSNVHDCARRGDMEALKGIWLYQELVFNRIARKSLQQNRGPPASLPHDGGSPDSSG